MARKRYTAEQIIGHLRQAEIRTSEGKTIAEVVRELGISEQTYYRWRKEYGGMEVNQARRLKELEQENGRLKRLVADQALDISILKEVSRGNFSARRGDGRRLFNVRETLAVSERRACRVLGQVRRTQRYTPTVADDEGVLTANVVSLATEYGWYGYRRITALLRTDGWRVNHKRVERIWRQEGLKVPARQPKRGRLWFNDGSWIRLRPEHRNHVWAYDFVFDRTREGRPLKCLTVVDEYSRECLAIEVARKQTSRDVLRTLAQLMLKHGVPKHPVGQRPGVRGQGCPILALQGRPDTLHRAGQPLGERIHRKLQRKAQRRTAQWRDLHDRAHEARVLTTWWRRHYNHVRPHSALGYRPPAPVVINPPIAAAS